MTDPRAPPDVQAAFCAVLVDEWARAGVTDAVVAPGSRSTPLVLALDADRRVRVHVVLDERSAGFVALGLGLATGRPAVVATTSGTAAVELHPAVVEASHAGVPLIAVTADRPPELHGVGAPQTVEQDGLFGPSPRWAVSPGRGRGGGRRQLAVAGRPVRGGGDRRAGRTRAGAPQPGVPGAAARDRGRGSAAVAPAGRDEPAAPVARAAVAAGRTAAGGGGRAAGGARGRAGLDRGRGRRRRPGDAGRRGPALGWPLLADPRSGCRVPGEPVVAAADALLRVPEIAAWRPDVVLRSGRRGRPRCSPSGWPAWTRGAPGAGRPLGPLGGPGPPGRTGGRRRPHGAGGSLLAAAGVAAGCGRSGSRRAAGSTSAWCPAVGRRRAGRPGGPRRRAGRRRVPWR